MVQSKNPEAPSSASYNRWHRHRAFDTVRLRKSLGLCLFASSLAVGLLLAYVTFMFIAIGEQFGNVPHFLNELVLEVASLFVFLSSIYVVSKGERTNFFLYGLISTMSVVLIATFFVHKYMIPEVLNWFPDSLDDTTMPLSIWYGVLILSVFCIAAVAVFPPAKRDCMSRLIEPDGRPKHVSSRNGHLHMRNEV
ncbi:hypothetical protein OAU50_08355 [Planctomycetota bacterium]|nr:hypothetical protein [Planctomycetota bacterium]